jgi:hypothetical protein
MADDSALREIMTGIGNNAAPNRLGQAMSQYSEPAIQQIQQILQMLFAAKQDPNAGLVNDPLSGGPMSRSPLRQRMVGPSADPSMGMGY